MRDERIEQAKNKIRSEMATIIFIAMAVSFLTKALIFRMDFKECITEYAVMIFFPLYQFIRMHMMEISIYSNYEKKQSIKNLIVTIIILLIVSVISIFVSMTKSPAYNWQSGATRILTYSVLFVAIFFITIKYNKHRSEKYEREFDDK